jgi:hypothetical protein
VLDWIIYAITDGFMSHLPKIMGTLAIIALLMLSYEIYTPEHECSICYNSNYSEGGL